MSSNDQMFWIGSPSDISKLTETERVLWGLVCKQQSENDEQNAKESQTRSVATKTMQSRKAQRWMVLQKYIYDRSIKHDIGTSLLSISETLASLLPAVSIGGSEYNQKYIEQRTEIDIPPSVYGLLSSSLLHVDVVDDDQDCKDSYLQFVQGSGNPHTHAPSSIALKRANKGYFLSPSTRADVVSAIKSIRKIFILSGKKELFHSKVSVRAMFDSFSKACLALNTVAKGVAETHSQHKAALLAVTEKVHKLTEGSDSVSNTNNARLTMKNSNRMLLLQHHKPTHQVAMHPVFDSSFESKPPKNMKKKKEPRPMSGMVLTMPTESIYSVKNMKKPARPQTAAISRKPVPVKQNVPQERVQSRTIPLARPTSAYLTSNRVSSNLVTKPSTTTTDDSKNAPNNTKTSVLFEYHDANTPRMVPTSTSTSPLKNTVIIPYQPTSVLSSQVLSPNIPLPLPEGGILVPYSPNIRSTSGKSAIQRYLTKGVNQMQNNTHATTTAPLLTHRDRSAMYLSAELGMHGEVHEHDIQNHGVETYAVTADPSLFMNTLSRDLPIYSERHHKQEQKQKKQKYQVKGGLTYMHQKLAQMSHNKKHSKNNNIEKKTILSSSPPPPPPPSSLTSHTAVVNNNTTNRTFQQRITNSPYGKPIFSSPPPPASIPIRHGFKTRPNTATLQRKIPERTQSTILRSHNYLSTAAEIRQERYDPLVRQNEKLHSSDSYQPPKSNVATTMVAIPDRDNVRLQGTFRSTVEQAQLDALKRAWRGDLQKHQSPTELEEEFNRDFKLTQKHVKPVSSPSNQQMKYWKEPRWKDSTVASWREYSVEKYRERLDHVLQVVDERTQMHNNMEEDVANNLHVKNTQKIQSKREAWKLTEESIRDSHTEQEMDWMFKKEAQRQKLELQRSNNPPHNSTANSTGHLVNYTDIFEASENETGYSQDFSEKEEIPSNKPNANNNDYSEDFNDTPFSPEMDEYSAVFNDTTIPVVNNSHVSKHLPNTTNENVYDDLYNDVFQDTGAVVVPNTSSSSDLAPEPPNISENLFNTSKSTIKPDNEEYWDDYDSALARFDESEQVKSAQNSINEASVNHEDDLISQKQDESSDDYSYNF